MGSEERHTEGRVRSGGEMQVSVSFIQQMGVSGRQGDPWHPLSTFRESGVFSTILK